MKYQTQKVAMTYFYGALVLFLAQVAFGVLAGTIYVLPNTLSELLPFNIIRMIHTNALVVWLLMGFMGATYYLLPEETETELFSPKLAIIQFWMFFIAAGVAVVGYLFRIHEGREFLEQPFVIKVGIVVVVLMFLFNITMTALKGRKTTITNILLFGLWALAIFFLFSFYNPSNLALDKMYWWYVIHLWVEGVWELIMASVLAFLMIKLNGVDREVVEKWLYIIVGLALFSGILGTGHHYYWIGAPGYWQWIGSLFSTLEVAPFFSMVAFTVHMTWKAGRNHPNKAALLWSIGCSVMAFFGAGVWGFLHTLSSVNYYTHGTQVTAAHGHLAFFGAYVMLNLAMMAYAIPEIKGRAPYNQWLSIVSFWMMVTAMSVMTFALTFAGVVQVHLQRVLGESFMDVQDQLALFYWVRLGSGVVVVVSALMFMWAVLVPGRQRSEKPARILQPAE
ncbi:cbb3-type cytochrome c oxidase subunit I [Aminobacter sp. NyZ550]|uniref:Nitric oxide reductase n=2 Tax=Aminobacter TaxID=31988 RepID=A0AAC8YSZ5_AMIAI|nr:MULTISPECIES: cbb3-type cytochrome c oxidase subunit I [Aminobacter]AMS43972.1 nitric oxide reductase [Aminobacter aminovorans]MBA8909661.1 nitric oxide reductase subunit B [Aminobacter ciceronei]MBA9023485.1 nitric oxide reductase subunit B [Aminobacter ciceronei]MBB3705641.1 nitric oxide reductase subunit B [Aminobacter aminovorans]MDR7224644.1 nitric oxide reductase subunit B [Aminobacter aminovorans]